MAQQPALRVLPPTPVDSAFVNPDPAPVPTHAISRSSSAKSHGSSALAKSEKSKSESSKSRTGSKKSFVSGVSLSSLGRWSGSGEPSRQRGSIRLVRRGVTAKQEDGEKSEASSSGKPVKKRSGLGRLVERLVGGGRSDAVGPPPAPPPGRTPDTSIVEDWLLSIQDLQPELQQGGGLQAGPARHDQAVTPTNEEVELESKATGSETNRILFDVSCSEEESDCEAARGGAERGGAERGGRAGSLFRRQVSESSEYTTDTHDTGEVAAVTALNTMRNTSQLFTSEGDRCREELDCGFRPITGPAEEASSERGSGDTVLGQASLSSGPGRGISSLPASFCLRIFLTSHCVFTNSGVQANNVRPVLTVWCECRLTRYRVQVVLHPSLSRPRPARVPRPCLQCCQSPAGVHPAQRSPDTRTESSN